MPDKPHDLPQKSLAKNTEDTRFILVDKADETRFVLVDSPEETSTGTLPATKKTFPQRLHEKPLEVEKESFSNWFFRKFGGAGFSFSVIFHAILIVCALLWITVKYTVPAESEPDAFVTGAGGGRGGERPSMAEHALRKRPRPETKDRAKITSKTASSAIVLPEMKMDVPAMRSATGTSFGEGELSSGFGGGLGGGVGTGTGVGVGEGKNFVGKFAPRKVMGANVYAERIAVYLDCSGSMSAYLPRVKEEIYDKFPDADIFEFDGIRVDVIDGDVLAGKSTKAKKFIAGNRIIGIPNRTNSEKLSKKGAAIYKKYSANFEIGSVGSWFDTILDERYDALVIFSDFYDGLRQLDSKTGRTLYADSAYKPTKIDNRKARDLRWEKDWKNTFSRKNAPKIYLFSIGIQPQKFWQELVELSDGKITDVKYLKKDVDGENPDGENLNFPQNGAGTFPASTNAEDDEDV